MSSTKTYVFQPYVIREVQVRGKVRPKARSGHRIVCGSLDLYSYGGYNPSVSACDPQLCDDLTWLGSKPLFREIWQFNFLTRRWTRLTNNEEMPFQVASSAVIVKDGKLIAFGGTGFPFGVSRSNSLYTRELRNRSSAPEAALRLLPASGDLPKPLYGQAMVHDDSYLYSVGGTTGSEYNCDIHRYDLKNEKWESLYLGSGDGAEPKGRYRHEIVLAYDSIHILGGGCVAEAFDFEHIPAFHLKMLKWMYFATRKDPICNAYPGPRLCHSLVQHRDEDTGYISVVISGGHGPVLGGGIVQFRDLWRLDIDTFQWTCLTEDFFPSPTYFHSACATPSGKMYTFGGVVTAFGVESRTDAIHSAWIVIPKLSEICWEALCHYISDLDNKYDELVQMGVPWNFLTRLRDQSQTSEKRQK